MAAEASTRRLRPGSPASARVAAVAAGLAVAAFGVCGVLLLLTRDYQRAAYGAGGTVAALVCLVVGFVVARRQPASPIGWLLLGWSLLTPVVGVALLYSVLDYRIFSRTLAYAIVTGLLVGVYLGLVLLASLVRPSSSPVVVAGSTLVVAALFHPLRSRVQRVVDRRFNRARYNADQIVTAFAARLQDAVDLSAIRDELANAVHAALEPSHLSVWLKEPPA